MEDIKIIYSSHEDIVIINYFNNEILKKDGTVGIFELNNDILHINWYNCNKEKFIEINNEKIYNHYSESLEIEKEHIIPDFSGVFRKLQTLPEIMHKIQISGENNIKSYKHIEILSLKDNENTLSNIEIIDFKEENIEKVINANFDNTIYKKDFARNRELAKDSNEIINNVQLLNDFSKNDKFFIKINNIIEEFYIDYTQLKLINKNNNLFYFFKNIPNNRVIFEKEFLEHTEFNKILIKIDNDNFYRVFCINFNDNVYYDNTNAFDEIINICHKNWTEKCIINKVNSYIYRLYNQTEYGKFLLENNKLIVNWDKWEKEIFIFNTEKNYWIEDSLNLQNIKESINNTMILNNINNINNIDNIDNIHSFCSLHSQSTPKMAEVKLYHIDWIDYCIIENFTIYRKSSNEKGTYKYEDNKLMITWDNWDTEIFIFFLEFSDQYYHEKYIKYIKLDNNILLLNTYLNTIYNSNNIFISKYLSKDSLNSKNIILDKYIFTNEDIIIENYNNNIYILYENDFIIKYIYFINLNNINIYINENIYLNIKDLDFNINIYKLFIRSIIKESCIILLNSDNDIQLFSNWIKNDINKNSIFSVDTFLNKYKFFDIYQYKINNNLNNLEDSIFHWYNNGLLSKYFYSKSNIEIIYLNEIIENNLNINLNLNNIDFYNGLIIIIDINLYNQDFIENLLDYIPKNIFIIVNININIKNKYITNILIEKFNKLIITKSINNNFIIINKYILNNILKKYNIVYNKVLYISKFLDNFDNIILNLYNNYNIFNENFIYTYNNLINNFIKNKIIYELIYLKNLFYFIEKMNTIFNINIIDKIKIYIIYYLLFLKFSKINGIFSRVVFPEFAEVNIENTLLNQNIIFIYGKVYELIFN